MKADFKFPRSWEDTDEDGNKLTFTAQPYVTSLYFAESNASSSQGQFTCSWRNVPKLIKSLQKSKTVTNLDLQPINRYLSEEDISFI
jgi:hypothetical protein